MKDAKLTMTCSSCGRTAPMRVADGRPAGWVELHCFVAGRGGEYAYKYVCSMRCLRDYAQATLEGGEDGR